jgi:hypothetical protein
MANRRAVRFARIRPSVLADPVPAQIQARDHPWGGPLISQVGEAIDS